MKKIVLFVAVLALSACSKVTKENYDLLEMGMTADEVMAILGEADNCSEKLGTKSCIWGTEEGKHIKISFIADNAATFSNNGL